MAIIELLINVLKGRPTDLAVSLYELKIRGRKTPSLVVVLRFVEKETKSLGGNPGK